jgi:hypothetical protein
MTAGLRSDRVALFEIACRVSAPPVSYPLITETIAKSKYIVEKRFSDAQAKLINLHDTDSDDGTR